jgi:hypothetical protein
MVSLGLAKVSGGLKAPIRNLGWAFSQSEQRPEVGLFS